MRNKLFGRLVGMLLPAILLLVLIVPGQIIAASSYPNAVAGFPVVFVKTPRNTTTLTNGETILVLFAEGYTRNAASTILRNTKVDLPKGYSLEIFGGPNSSSEKYISNHAQAEDTYKKYGVPTFSIPSGSISPTSVMSQTILVDLGRTYSVIQNNDVGNQDLIGMAVTLTAPNKGNNQNGWSNFLLNGVNDADWKMQTGFYFPASSGAAQVIYTDTEHNLTPQPFGVDYNPGDNYIFWYYYTGTLWEIGVENLDTSEWDIHDEGNFSGTQLTDDPSYAYANSVFIEHTNYVQNPTWYSGFDSYLYADNAEDCDTSNNWTSWSDGQAIIITRHAQSWSTSGRISGNLESFSTASWYLAGLPTMSDY
jgi:hypothetical protein